MSFFDLGKELKKDMNSLLDIVQIFALVIIKFQGTRTRSKPLKKHLCHPNMPKTLLLLEAHSHRKKILSRENKHGFRRRRPSV